MPEDDEIPSLPELGDDAEGDSSTETNEGEEKEADTDADTDAKGDDGDGEEKDDGDDEASYGPRVQKRIRRETFKRRQAELRAAEAELRLADYQKRIEELTGRADDASKSAFEARENALNAEFVSVQNAYKAAAEAGDTDKQFEASATLARIAADRKALEYEKRQVEAAQRQQQPEQKQQQPPHVDNSQAEVWLADNTWFGHDKPMTRVAYGIDADLKEEGYDPRKPEFYAELDRRLRETFPHKFKEKPVTKKQPVVGASRTSDEQKKGKLPKLTERELDIARRLNVPPEEYARFKRVQ